MTVSVLIGTYGDQAWADLAWGRAFPSADAEGPHEIGIEHQYEGTLAAVRNSLAEDAQGDWLCFLDADDELAPGYLSAMAKGLARNHMTFAMAMEMRREGLTWGSIAKRLKVTPERLAQQRRAWDGQRKSGPAWEKRNGVLVPRVQYISTPQKIDGPPVFPNEGQWPEMNTAVIGTLIARSLFREVGGFREGEYEDYDLWLRCERAGAHQIRVPDAIYRAYISREGRNANPETRRLRTQAHIRLLREHRDWMKAKA